MGEREDLSGRMVGEFVLRERIDAGGFGDVYRCDQPMLDRQAVVKVLHRRLRNNDVLLQRFLREAQLASRLDHPYAAHVYKFGIEHDDGLFWIAMELVQGISLTRWLREHGPLPLEDLVPFFECVAEVVQTAHDRGIVHRDLKPSNVMVIERAGRLLPKLLDFGIAKLVDAPPETAGAAAPTAQAVGSGESPSWAPESEVVTLTVENSAPGRIDDRNPLTNGARAMGSPPYMAPEQWTNAGMAGVASDLYALGVVAFEALTGRRPFQGDTPTEFRDLHCHAPVPPLGNGHPPALDRWFQRALAKQPGDRFASALELAAGFRTASGIDNAAADLPRIDDAVRDAWLADAPEPLAELVAALDEARNAHQARDVVREVVRHLLRYLQVLALVTRAQVREDRGGAALLDLVRTMRVRDLRDDERIKLIRLLVRPLSGRRDAHPLPELVELVTTDDDHPADGLEPMLALLAISDGAGNEHGVRSWLGQLIPVLGQLLRRTRFVLDYVLVVPRNAVAERWTGRRRAPRTRVTTRAGELAADHPMLLDKGRVCVDLWPLVQVVAPREGAEPELFVLDGRGRHGARLIAAPGGLEHLDPTVWDWIASRVIAELEPELDASEDHAPPYLGLTAFSVGDAARFFGREPEVRAFVDRLARQPLLVVVGPSGAGKSSFVHAGVIAALPAGWRAVTLRPGSAPIAQLASKLATAQLTAADLRPVLESSPAALAALLAHSASGGSIAIVIDQLEELFTLCTSADERDQLAQVIAQLAASADRPIRVVCAIRDDFLMQLEALAPLRPLLSQAIVLLGNPSHDALVRIVAEPARRTGYTLSDADLAHDMASAVVDRQGALALLSFTASRLWALRDRRFRQLTRSAYDAMGGVGGALGHHAEDTLREMSADDQQVARRIFCQLVTADGTRAQVARSELRQRLATSRADGVVDRLVAARLLSLAEADGEARVEVIHEALISAWPRLAAWMREDVDDVRMRDQLRAAARQWHERGRPRGLLWRDDVLVDLERWLRRPNAGALSGREAEFVDASRRVSRRAKRIRNALLLIALSMAIAFAVTQCRATQEIRTAEELAQRRLIQSYSERGRQALLDNKFGEAAAYLAYAAQHGDDSTSTPFMIARAARPLQAELAHLKTPSGRMLSAMFSPDGRRIITTDDGGARVWDAATHQQVLSLPHDNAVFQAVFTPDGRELVAPDLSGVVKIWDLSTGQATHVLTDSTLANGWSGVAISSDGNWIAAIDFSGGVVHVWNARTDGLVATLETGAAASVPALAFSADARWLAASGGGDVQVFDTRSWRRAAVIPGPQVTSLSFDPTGPHLAVATARGEAAIWPIPAGEPLRLPGGSGNIVRIAYAPNGELVVAGDRDGNERVWNASTAAVRYELRNHREAVKWVEIDPTSTRVVSTGIDGTLTISDIATGTQIASFEGSQFAVTSARFSPDAHQVISTSFLDSTARLWDASPLYRRWTSPVPEPGCADSISLDEDRRFLSVHCAAQSYIWDTKDDRPLAQLPNAANAREHAAPRPRISAAGDQVAIAVDDTVTVFRMPGSMRTQTIAHPATVSSLAFSDDSHDLLSGSVDGTILVTRAGGAPSPVTVPEKRAGIDAVGFLRDGRIIAANEHGELMVFDATGVAMRAELALGTRARSFRMTADGRRLIVLPFNNLPSPPILVDMEHLRVVGPLKAPNAPAAPVFAARFVLDDQEILTASADGNASMWSAETGTRLQSYRGSRIYLVEAVLDPSGAIVVGAAGDGTLRFWDRLSGDPIWTLRAHRSAIGGIHFEGADLVTRSLAGEISRWQLPTISPLDIAQLAHCAPLLLDETSGKLVEQPPCPTAPHSTRR